MPVLKAPSFSAVTVGLGCTRRSVETGTFRSAHVVPASSTTQHHAVCPTQMKWFSSSLALNTSLPANLSARLKLNFPLLLGDVCVPTACPGSGQQPEPAAHDGRAGTPVQLGLGVPPATVLCQQDLVRPGNPHHCWPGLGPLMAPGPSAKSPQCCGAQRPGPPSPPVPWCPPVPSCWGWSPPSSTVLSMGARRAGRCSWMQLQTALHTSTGY